MDTRRVGHAQRRRAGAPSNVYSDTMKPPTYVPGDTVTAKGRYGPQTVSNVISKAVRPDDAMNVDGHAYEVTGGKKGKTTTHLSNDMKLFPSHILGVQR